MKLCLAIAMMASGCGATLEMGSVAADGRVTAPELGAVLEGDTASMLIRVAGTYPDPGRVLLVEALDDPDDLTSWTSIGSAPVNNAGAFGIDVQPGAGLWPSGGVLRLRVIDETGAVLPIAPPGDTPITRTTPTTPSAPTDVPDPGETIVAVVNPGKPPGTWLYLDEKAGGSEEETRAYYAAIAAPPTLLAFQVQYGFGAGETVADYYNVNDLGIGRDTHCTVPISGVAGSAAGFACYVRNYGTFGGGAGAAMAALAAGGPPIETVAMVYQPPAEAPNAVTFLVYDASGALATRATLDTIGDNVSVPQSCLNCHGGRASYDAATHTAVGGKLVPFDPAALDASAAPTAAGQPAALHRLDQLVAGTAPAPATGELLTGLFQGDGAFDPGYAPAAWSTSARDRAVYRQVIAPYCRSCHATFAGASDTATFSSPDSVRAHAADIVSGICGAGPHGMPAAEVTAARFFASSARALLLSWLDAPGSCARH